MSQRNVAIRYLSVHEDIDDWVVDGGALCKVCRHGCSQRMEGVSRVGRSEAGKKGVRSPAYNISQDHDHNHPGYFSLSFLGWLRLLLLHGNLWLTKNTFCHYLINETWSNIKSKLYARSREKTYSTDGQPHCKVAQDNDSQGNDTAGNHKNNHVGLDSRVFTSTEYIGSTRGFQSMGPIPDSRKPFVFIYVPTIKVQVHLLFVLIHQWLIALRWRQTNKQK